MKHLLPGRTELVVLILMAVAIALVASHTLPEEAALSVGAMPLFVASCLLGMRRNGQLSRRD